MKSYAALLKEKAGAKYFCHTAFDTTGNSFFLIEDVTWTPSRAELICNGMLYHHTLRECIEHLRGTHSEIRYRGKNVNPLQPDIFLSMNRYTGEVYREYHEDWSVLDGLGKAV